MKVGQGSYTLFGVTKIAFLSSPISCICLVSIIHICIYSIFVAILKFKVRCRYVHTL